MSVSILVVDDEHDVADLFRRRFRKELKQGIYSIQFALCGQDALDKIKEQIEPELMLILSDINMPGMSGLELLTQVKNLLPSLPVVMITAYGDDDNRERARKLGAAQFLKKPIEFGELRETIS